MQARSDDNLGWARKKRPLSDGLCPWSRKPSSHQGLPWPQSFHRETRSFRIGHWSSPDQTAERALWLPFRVKSGVEARKKQPSATAQPLQEKLTRAAEKSTGFREPSSITWNSGRCRWASKMSTCRRKAQCTYQLRIWKQVSFKGKYPLWASPVQEEECWCGASSPLDWRGRGLIPRSGIPITCLKFNFKTLERNTPKCSQWLTTVVD